MVKIWGKLLVENKIMRDSTISVDEKSTTFFDMLKQLCASLNIPTPVLLTKHVHDFNVFNICTFKPNDFVEPVVFDRFELSHL